MIKFCSLYSGSSGNCTFLEYKDTRLLIDAGLSGIKITKALNDIGCHPSQINAILVSHEHIDHIRGAGILSKKYDIPVYANSLTWEAMECSLMQVASKNKSYFSVGCQFEIGDIVATSFSIPHDAKDPVGFNFFAKDKKITTATDIGHINDALLENFKMSHAILLESNHDVEMLKVGKYPWSLKQRIMGDKGHLSNETAGHVVAHLAKCGTKNFLLGHLSHENNFPELAYQTVHNILVEKNINIESDITLDIAHRNMVSKIIEL